MVFDDGCPVRSKAPNETATEEAPCVLCEISASVDEEVNPYDCEEARECRDGVEVGSVVFEYGA